MSIAGDAVASRLNIQAKGVSLCCVIGYNTNFDSGNLHQGVSYCEHPVRVIEEYQYSYSHML